MTDFDGLSLEPFDARETASGIPAGDLTIVDLLRELEVVHATRHETFLHGSEQALEQHDRRTEELEGEYLDRFPQREIDPLRTRDGARAGGVEAPLFIDPGDDGAPGSSGLEPRIRTGADQPWEPEDLAVAEGRDPTPANVERARRELADDGPAAIERTVP
jgi:uncharacterized protein DUF6158